MPKCRAGTLCYDEARRSSVWRLCWELRSAFIPQLLYRPRAGSATQPVQQPSSSKRPITHQDYDSWRSIQASQISRDGKYVAYAFMQQDGDGEIVVRNVGSGVEWRAPRGYRPPVPPPDDPSVNIGEVLAAQARLVRPVFTADSRFVVFSIEPTKAEINKAKKEKKKPEDMPKTGLGIMDVSTGAVTRVEKVKNFQVPEDGSGFIAYLLEPQPEKKPEPNRGATPKPEASPAETLPAEAREPKVAATPSASPSPAASSMPFPQPGETPVQPSSSQPSGAPPTAAADRKKKEYGSELVLRNLANMSDRKFADALDYTLSKDAKTLVYAVSARKEDANGVYAVATQTDRTDAPPQALLVGKGKYQKLTWDEDQTQLAFISDKDDASAKQPKSRVYHWNRSATPAIEVVSNSTPGFRKDFVVSDKANLSFSLDGSRLFLGAAPPPEPEKNPDERRPPMKKSSSISGTGKTTTYSRFRRCARSRSETNPIAPCITSRRKRFVQLADETMENICSVKRWPLRDRHRQPAVSHDGRSRPRLHRLLSRQHLDRRRAS